MAYLHLATWIAGTVLAYLLLRRSAIRQYTEDKYAYENPYKWGRILRRIFLSFYLWIFILIGYFFMFTVDLWDDISDKEAPKWL
jgi:hypothetical protein